MRTCGGQTLALSDPSPPHCGPHLTQAHLPCPRQPPPCPRPLTPLHFTSHLLDAILYLRCCTNFATPCSELSHAARYPQG